MAKIRKTQSRTNALPKSIARAAHDEAYQQGHPPQALPLVVNELFFTERQLAERWQLSIKVLQNWRTSGKGPAFRKFGSSVRYALTDIILYEEQSYRTNTIEAEVRK